MRDSPSLRTLAAALLRQLRGDERARVPSSGLENKTPHALAFQAGTELPAVGPWGRRFLSPTDQLWASTSLPHSYFLSPPKKTTVQLCLCSASLT